MQNTKSGLLSSVAVLNTVLGRPATLFNDSGKQNVGHLLLDKDATGYKLEEIVTDSGSVTALSGRMTAGDMAMFLSAVMVGISLRNKHLTELVLRDELINRNLSNKDHPLYGE